MFKYLIIYFIFLISSISATEIDFMGMAKVDKEPQKIAWVNDSKEGWYITTWFEKLHVNYFFKEGPTQENGLNLKANNPPYKIVVKDFISNNSFILKNIAYEQWDDGAKSYSGEFDKPCVINGEKFKTIIVSLIQETPDKNNYANYSLWR